MIFEIQCWSKSQSLTFCVSDNFSSVDQISTINPLILRNDLSHEIRSRYCVWILKIMLQAIRSCTRSKVNDQSFSVKTLILTILPLWWFECFPWGIMINPWSIDEYDFKMLMLAKNHEVWLYIDHNWLFTQYSWFSVIWAIDWANLWCKTWNLVWEILKTYNEPWKSFEESKVQLSLRKPKP